MNTCAPVDLLTEPGAVEQAVCNVAERSFFAFAERGDLSLAADVLSTGTPVLSASVRYVGPHRGQMHVTMPSSLARELARQFSGDPDLDFSDADLIDMTGEFANMVTGSWLTATDMTSTYDLSAPVVTTIEALPPVTLLMLINGQPVLLFWQAE